ncbi:hypothetical protein FRB93_001908 [Tulasnella sp. JGI-2019a]|nr:hypothetical protein FRB93_001908 [Tulasnella sp. JGI-2019a]
MLDLRSRSASTPAPTSASQSSSSSQKTRATRSSGGLGNGAPTTPGGRFGSRRRRWNPAGTQSPDMMQVLYAKSRIAGVPAPMRIICIDCLSCIMVIPPPVSF